MDHSVLAKVADWLAWSQLWIKSPFNANNYYIGLESVQWVSSWAEQVMHYSTGKSYVEHLLVENATNSLENQKENLLKLLVQLWVLPEDFDNGISLDNIEELSARLVQYFGINDPQALATLNKLVILRQALKLTILEDQVLASQQVAWGDLEVQKILIEAHDQVYEAANNIKDDLPTKENIKYKGNINWKFLGFQGTDPATDFRSMGTLAARNFARQCTNFPESSALITIESRNLETDTPCWYSFALISIHLTRLLLDLLQSGLLIGYIIDRLDDIDIRENSHDFSANSRVSAHQESFVRYRGDATKSLDDGKKSGNLSENETHLEHIVLKIHQESQKFFHILLDKFHRSWLLAVEKKEITSVMQTDEFLQNFRILIAEQLWSGETFGDN